MIEASSDILPSVFTPGRVTAAGHSPGRAESTEALEQALAALHGKLLPGEGTAPSPATGGRAGEGFAHLAGLDLSLLISVIQTELRDASAQRGEVSAEDAAHHAESAQVREQRALERAEKAGRRAERLMKRAPKWVKKFVSAIISAVGVLASVYTGGASLGLAIAGATLLLMADTLVPMLERAGLVDADQAAWIKLGLQVAGTVLSCASGSGATNAVPRAVDAVGTATRVVEGTMEAVDGGLDIGIAALAGQQDDATLDAGGAALDLELANAELAEELQQLADSAEFFRRIAGRVSALAEVERNTRLSSVRQLA